PPTGDETVAGAGQHTRRGAVSRLEEGTNRSQRTAELLYLTRAEHPLVRADEVRLREVGHGLILRVVVEEKFLTRYAGIGQDHRDASGLYVDVEGGIQRFGIERIVRERDAVGFFFGEGAVHEQGHGDLL